MLRQSELRRVLGWRLIERLLRAGWIEPVLLERRDPGLGSSEDQGMNVLGSFIGIYREQVH